MCGATDSLHAVGSCIRMLPALPFTQARGAAGPASCARIMQGLRHGGPYIATTGARMQRCSLERWSLHPPPAQVNETWSFYSMFDTRHAELGSWFKDHTPIDSRVAISTHGGHWRPEMSLAGRAVMTSYAGCVLMLAHACMLHEVLVVHGKGARACLALGGRVRVLLAPHHTLQASSRSKEGVGGRLHLCRPPYHAAGGESCCIT